MKEKPQRASDPPLQGLTDLAELLAGFTGGALLGGAIGIGLAEYLRARGRRWTWALTVAPFAAAIAAGVLVSPLRGWAAASGVGMPVGILIGAVGWGAYRRIEDSRASQKGR